MGSNINYLPLRHFLAEKPRNGLYKGKEFQGEGKRWIKMNQVFSLDFLSDNDETELLTVTESEIERFSCAKGDLLFGRTSLTLEGVGDCLLIKSIKDSPIFESNLFRLRFDSCKAYPLFFYYFFKSPYGRQTIQRIAKQTAATSITASDLIEEDIPSFSYEKQKSIGDLVHSLDLKIELNCQTNQTLEQMAQSLFKSWFVDFDPVFDNALAKANYQLDNLPADFPEALRPKAEKRLAALQAVNKTAGNDANHPHFPSEFEFNEQLGWIPEGWEGVTLESLITLIGGGTPKTSVEEYWNGDIPWFSVVDAPNDSDVFVIDTDKHVTQLGVDKSSTKILRAGTTIISARGTVGKCALVANPMAMNQSCYGINGKDNISDEFIYYLTRYQVSDLQKRGHGSVFNTITRETFKSIQLPFSGEKVTIEFSKVVSSFFDKILNNNNQNLELTKLRDTLLPKLISGELQIPTSEPRSHALRGNAEGNHV